MFRDAGGVQIATRTLAHQRRNTVSAIRPKKKKTAVKSAKDARRSRTLYE